MGNHWRALGLFLLLMVAVTGCGRQCEITCNDGFSTTNEGGCGLEVAELALQHGGCSSEETDETWW